MKKFFLALILALVSSLVLMPVQADAARVKGYTKKDGTYVKSHQRSVKDDSKSKNYAAKGNTNPNTGKKGTVPVSQTKTKKKK